jgi:hypothetical protein
MVAVSHGYAWECQTQEGGWGLHEVFQEHAWKLRGVVNGIDYAEWHPAVDPHLTSGGQALRPGLLVCCLCGVEHAQVTCRLRSHGSAGGRCRQQPQIYHHGCSLVGHWAQMISTHTRRCCGLLTYPDLSL